MDRKTVTEKRKKKTKEKNRKERSNNKENIGEQSTKTEFPEFNILTKVEAINCVLKHSVMLNIPLTVYPSNVVHY